MYEIKKGQVDTLHVMVFDSPQDMGQQAAEAIASDMKDLAAQGRNIRMMFAAAPSQNTTLEHLALIENLPWDKVSAFHMDEYVGVREEEPQSFRYYLREKLFSRLPLAKVHLICGEAANPEDEAASYAHLLQEGPLDIVVLGVGENGHIAFNDPPDASFTDPQYTRLIRLSEASRVQQVHDGCFAQLNDVPTHAITVTIPGIMRASSLHCVVPGVLKQKAIKAALFGPVSPDCPASILRTHPRAFLYLDSYSDGFLLD